MAKTTAATLRDIEREALDRAARDYRITVAPSGRFMRVVIPEAREYLALGYECHMERIGVEFGYGEAGA